MKKFLCLFILMISALIAPADYHDPNHEFKYDQDLTSDTDYASAYASEYTGNQYWNYYASASATHKVSTTITYQLHVKAGNFGHLVYEKFRGKGSDHTATWDDYRRYESSATGSSTCGNANAYARIW